MTDIKGRTLVNRNRCFAVFISLAIVMASGGLSRGWAQDSGDRAIDQAQRAVRQQITTREGGRDPIVQFNSDAWAERKSNTEVRVRGTGIFSRNSDGKSRPFSYEAVVNNRNGKLSNLRYDWQGNWYSGGGVGYQGQTVYVASTDGRRHTYPADTSGGVRLVQQRSDSPCVQWETWGYDRDGIWVDRGCRAEFAVGRGGVSSNYAANRLTGTYRLDQARSDNPATVADRVTSNLPAGEQQRLRNAIMRRLQAPESLAIERRGRTITMTSSHAAPVTFEADGREQTEQSRNGRTMRTNATLAGERLVVTTEGDRSIDYQVTFEPTDNGRSLRITRRVTDEGLRQPVVARSVYDKTSDVSQLNMYAGVRESHPAAVTPRGNFVVPDGIQLVAFLNDNLSTRQARDGDRFSLTVRSPAQFEGASIEGHVARVNRSGQVTGRAGMSFAFDLIRLRDGRTSDFGGYVESVRTRSGEAIQVDNEGRAQEESQTTRTVTRTGIGAAIGAVIGAIAGGGQGAAIGAAVGAGAGAGSVYVQGREDLDLTSGTEFRLRASAPR